MTTFNSPLGLHWLTTLLMGHTNTVQIYQANMAFILQDEISHHTMLFIDDLLVKSEMSRYQRPDGVYKTISENPGVTLDSGRGKRRLLNKEVTRFPRRRLRRTRDKGVLGGLLQGTRVLGTSAASLSNDRLRKTFQGFDKEAYTQE